MSIRSVRDFRAAAERNPEIADEIRKTKSWEDMVRVARKFGYQTTVTSHLVFYRMAPSDLSKHEVEIFRDGGFPWCS